jgi:YHS domain-containing protein
MLAALLLFATLHTPEECVTKSGTITATYGDKTYAFRHADCREEFLKDPERYAQLYDALLEMQAAGMELEPATESLVPS